MEKQIVQTYRGAIQDLIRATWEAYDTAGALRDCAIQSEKEYWNTYRGQMYEAAQALSNLDNGMSHDVANRKI